MIGIKIVDIYLADFKSPFLSMLRGERSKRWFGTVGIDVKSGDHSKTFFLLVCSQAAIEKPLHNMPRANDKYTIVDSEIRIKDLRATAKKRISDIKAKDWDDFCIQMKSSFLIKN